MQALPPLRVGDLVEVLADDPEHDFYYGELTRTEPLTVNYISRIKAKGDVWRFDAQAYEVDVECINHVVDMSTCKKADGWRELGFVYRGDHEIIHEDDIDSEEEDEDYEPSRDGDDEDDGDGADSDDDDDGASSAAVEDSADEPVEDDRDYDDDIATTDGEEDVPTEDDEDDDAPAPKRRRS